MKRIRIIHKTEYFYIQSVKFGPHRAMMRLREGHNAHIARAWVDVESKAEVSLLRDVYDNSITILTFDGKSDKLGIASEVDVDLYYDALNEWPISPYARSLPF
jgi:Bacterial transglutaminase-like N-terminal region